jgi:hypothetical protein
MHFCKTVPGKEIYVGNLTSRPALPHQIIYDEWDSSKSQDFLLSQWDTTTLSEY